MNNNNNNFDEIDLELNEKLRNRDIVQKFVKNTKHKFIKIELNHKYEKSNVIVSTPNIKDWSKFHDTLDKELIRKGINDKGDIKSIHDTVDDNHELVFGFDDNNNDSSSSEEKKESKQEFVVNKYSEIGKGPLHEAIIVNGLPYFVKYDH